MQCKLLVVNRSGLYYEERPEREDNVKICDFMNEMYPELPFYGIRKIKAELQKGLGMTVNRKRICRLRRQFGLKTVYAKRKTGIASAHPHIKYPYLLRDMTIDKPNRVWNIDITYIPMGSGYAYLCAIIDWYSRMVLSYRVSNTMTADFCVETLDRAIRQFGRPSVLNSDQGSQFTSHKWLEKFKKEGIEGLRHICWSYKFREIK